MQALDRFILVDTFLSFRFVNEYETYSLILRKTYRPKVFENRVLREKELDVRREQVIGGWRNCI
jgi:hypothetical protein